MSIKINKEVCLFFKKYQTIFQNLERPIQLEELLQYPTTSCIILYKDKETNKYLFDIPNQITSCFQNFQVGENDMPDYTIIKGSDLTYEYCPLCQQNIQIELENKKIKKINHLHAKLNNTDIDNNTIICLFQGGYPDHDDDPYLPSSFQVFIEIENALINMILEQLTNNNHNLINQIYLYVEKLKQPLFIGIQTLMNESIQILNKKIQKKEEIKYKNAIQNYSKNISILTNWEIKHVMKELYILSTNYKNYTPGNIIILQLLDWYKTNLEYFTEQNYNYIWDISEFWKKEKNTFYTKLINEHKIPNNHYMIHGNNGKIIMDNYPFIFILTHDTIEKINRSKFIYNKINKYKYNLLFFFQKYNIPNSIQKEYFSDYFDKINIFY